MKREEIIEVLENNKKWLGGIDLNGCYGCSENDFEAIADELEQQPQEQEDETELGLVHIKPECRELHGVEKAFELAIEHIRKVYKLFATDANSYRTFNIRLNMPCIKSPSSKPQPGLKDCQKAELSAEEMVKELRESNPYPEDVFIPISNEVMASASKFLKDLNFSPDAIFGQWGRKVWNNCCDKVEEYASLNGYPEEFVEWLAFKSHGNFNPRFELHKYWDGTVNGWRSIFRKLDGLIWEDITITELYNYWLTNIKDK